MYWNPGLMSSSQVNLPLPPNTIVGRYRIERPISDGGFSIVYLAYDDFGSPVALKEYLPAFLALRTDDSLEPVVSEESRAAFDHGLRCFFEEGQNLSSLAHGNVVKVLDFFRANGTVYLVMEYERGRTLQDHIGHHKGTLSESFLRGTFSHLLSGLREVHTRKLLHLDIKPANIFLRANGVPVLLDFGAARQTLGRDTAQGQAMHTPGFAAPEQYSSEQPLGPWTDIYAIGATLYACLSAERLPPANGRLEYDTLRPAVQEWQGKYSAHLLGLIDNCLTLNPLSRPQSVFALQRELSEQAPVQKKWGGIGSIRDRLKQIVNK